MAAHPANPDAETLVSQIEALLFAASSPVPVQQLADICGVSSESVRQGVALLEERYRSSQSALQVVEVAGGKQLRTREEYFDLICRLNPAKQAILSQAALESLAIILYRQPVTRIDIDAIRGVNSTSALGTLLERGLIREAGRLDAPGRPVLYEVTAKALERLGLFSLDDLPPLDSTISSASAQMQLFSE